MRAIELYGAIVAQARQPAFFETLRVSDTPEGRMGLLILLLFPVLERLQSGSAAARRRARMLSEAFVTDIDDCLREMGVGDLTVPKKVKRAGHALAERYIAYKRAADGASPVEALAEEIASTVPGLEDNRSAGSLAAMIIDKRAAFARIEPEALVAHHLAYPATATRSAA